MANNNGRLQYDPALGNAVNKALADNPHILNSPGLAADAINSGNPTVNVPTLVHAATVNGTVQAAQDYAAENATPAHWWDGMVHSAVKGLSVLAKPLQEVQRDYKYIHSLYTRHGVMWGTLGTLAVAGGATIGTFLGGPEGTVLGGELAATGLRKIGGQLDEFKSSYADSENPNYKVSMGRDVANMLGAHGQTDQGWGKFVSGAVDAGFDLGLDPLMKIGALSKGVRAGKFIANDAEKTVPWLYRSRGVQDFLARNSSQLTGDVEQLNAVYKSGLNPTMSDRLIGTGRQYHNALRSLIGKDSGEITLTYPELAPVATDMAKIGKDALLSEAEKIDQLHKSFCTTLTVSEKMKQAAVGGVAQVPSRTVLRGILSKSSDKLKQWNPEDSPEIYNSNNATNFIVWRRTGTGELDAEGKPILQTVLPLALRPLSADAWKSAIAQKARTFSGYQPFSIDPQTLELSTKAFDPTAADASGNIYKVMRYSMGHKAAQQITSNFVDAINGGDLAEAKRIYGNGIHDMFVAAGFPNDTEAVSRLLDDIHVKVGEKIDGIYAHGYESKHLANEVTTDAGTQSTALSTDQIGKWSFPDFRQFKLAVRSLSNTGKLYGRVDEFTSKAYTDSIFKPFALLTAGFGMRVAAAEIIPTMIRFGGVNTAEAKIAGSAEKLYYGLAKQSVRNSADALGYKLTKGEEDHILSHVALQLSGGTEDYTALKWTKDKAKLAKADVLTSQLVAEAEAAGSHGAFLREQAGKIRAQKDAAQQKYDNLLALSKDPATAGSVTPEQLKSALESVKAIKVPTVRAKVAGGLSKIASESDLDLAARIAIATQGHMASGAVSAGHGTDIDFTEKQRQLFDLLNQKMGTAMTEDPSGKFAYYTQSDDHFPIYWTTAVQKMSQNQVYQSIAQDVMRLRKSGLTDDEAWREATLREEARIRGVEFDPKTKTMGAPLPVDKDTYAAERKLLARYKTQDPAEFAYHRTDNLRNHITGMDKTVHEDLLRQIGAGIKPNLKRISGTDPEARPSAVFGQALVPYIGPNIGQRITQEGFKKIVDPIVGNLSRQPLFFQHVKQAMEFYKPAVDKGFIDDNTALRLAMTRATHAMLPQIHNVALRSQFSVLARNYLPFYFAQEQAMKRYLRLGVDNPEMFRAYQLIDQGMNDPGFVQTDNQGNKYIMFPGVGELGAGVLSAATGLGMPVVGNLPLTVRGDTQSLSTVLPEIKMPGTSPFLSIGLNTLSSFFPQLSRPVKTVVGSRGFSASVVDSLIPSAPARAWFKALNANEQETTFHSAMLSALAAASYHNQLPPSNASPQVKQAFIDRIKNNARSILVIKGLLGTISPLSPQVNQEDPGLRDEFYKLVQSKNDYPAALHEFLKTHGNGAISYTVSRSEGTIPGATTPYTNEAINWIQDNEHLISGPHATGAAFLIPQAAGAAGDKQAIYDELLKMHLRQARTPQEFQDAVYISTGNNVYFDAKKSHDDARSVFEKAGDTESVKAEDAHWKDYVNGLVNANPIWATDFQSATKRVLAQKALSDLTALFATKKAPKNEQSALVSTLLKDYQQHTQARQQIKSFSNGLTLTDEDNNWQDYLANLAKTEPRLTTVINGVFRRLP